MRKAMRINEVIDLLGISKSELSRQLGVSRQAINMWRDLIPVQRVRGIVDLSKRRIKPADLRPDIFA